MFLSLALEILKQKKIDYRVIDKKGPRFEEVLAHLKKFHIRGVTFIILKNGAGKRYGALFPKYQQFDLSKAIKAIGKEVTITAEPDFFPALVWDLPFFVDKKVFEADAVFFLYDPLVLLISPEDLKKIFKLKAVDITEAGAKVSKEELDFGPIPEDFIGRPIYFSGAGYRYGGVEIKPNWSDLKLESVKLLEKKNVKYSIFRTDIFHVSFTENMMEEPDPGLIHVTVLKDKKGKKYAIISRERQHIDPSKAAKTVGKEVTVSKKDNEKMIDKEELFCPFLLKMPLFVDKKVFELPKIYLGSGKERTLIEISPKDLDKLIDFKTADIAQTGS